MSEVNKTNKTSESINTIDELGRILIPTNLRDRVCLEPNHKVSILLNKSENSFVLFKHLDKEFSVDELGRITIPQIIYEELGWNAGDKVFIELNEDDETLVLRLQPSC